MKRMLPAALIFVLTLTVACAGREPVLIDKKQAGDASLSCAQLHREVDRCTDTILEKYQAGKKKTDQTIGAAVVGYVIFPPALLAMDLKKADYKEMGAYQSRRNYLIKLADEKDCTWCGDVEDDDELMTRAAAEYEKAKKERQEKSSKNQHSGR